MIRLASNKENRRLKNLELKLIIFLKINGSLKCNLFWTQKALHLMINPRAIKIKKSIFLQMIIGSIQIIQLIK